MTQSSPPPEPASTLADRVRAAFDRSGDEAEAAELALQVGELARAGLPMPGGLRALAEELGDRKLARRLHRIADDLEAGVALGEALDARGEALPPHLRGLILAGARTGRLPELIGEFLAYYRAGDEIRRQFWLALFYPAALGALCLLSFGMIAAIPALSNQGLLGFFTDWGLAVPPVTSALIGLTQGFGEAGPWALVAPLLVALVGFGLLFALYSPSERRQLLHAVPLVGGLYRWTALGEFCRALATLTEAGLPLPEAIDLSARSARDASLRAPAGRVAESVANGGSLGDSVGSAGRAFPEGLGRFLNWAESRGSLPEALRLAAGMFEQRARAQGRFVAAFLAGLAVLVVAWWIAVIFLALVWPMLNLLGSL